MEELPNKGPTVDKKAKLHYEGSIFWLILWTIVFFPLGFILFFTGSSFQLNETTYRFKYEGSKFWLYFWTICFFPFAFVLLFLNGSAESTTEI